MAPSCWSCYLGTRLVVGVIDFFLDVLQSASLFSLGHPAWAGLTLALPVVAVIAAVVSVCVGRLVRGRGDGMSAGKFLLLSARALTALFEGLFESGPELVLQAVVLFHGVHAEDFQILADAEQVCTSFRNF
jgi:hypothetical protein